MAAPLIACTTIEQRGVVRFLWAKNMDAAKDIDKEMLPIWAAFLSAYPLLLLQDGGAPEYMYHDRTAWRCAFFVAKKYGCSKGCPYGQHFFVDILCCIHIFSPQKTHNATLFYRGICIQGLRHLVTAATSVHSCAYRSLCITIKLDSAAI
jgi:hypothetical protein